MKWYPLAHLAAVTMSCLCAEVRALQYMQLCANSASGIARALPSLLLYMYIFEFQDARCLSALGVAFRQLKTFSRIWRGEAYVWGGNGEIQVGWHPVIPKLKTADLSGSIFSSPVPEGHLKTDTAFITPAATEENICYQVILLWSQSSFVLVGRTLGGTPSTPCRAPP